MDTNSNSKTTKNTIDEKTKKLFQKWFWGLFGGILCLIAIIFFLISVGLVGYVPPLEELENPKNKLATEIYSSDNQVLGTFYSGKDNRMKTTYDELSPNLINALIATEDIRFYKHSGVDGKALLRAILSFGGGGGASTITQQTAKLLYTNRSGNIFKRIPQKLNEWVIAIRLEKLFTKEEIMSLYFNKFDFLNNAVGIKTASKVYFNTTPDKLTIPQAALLVGMCKNPSLYNPASRREATRQRALDRRNTVLNQMAKYKFITKADAEKYKKMPLGLDYHSVGHDQGLAPYMREYLRTRLSAKKPKRSNYADWQLKPYGQYYLDSLAWETDPLYGFIEKNPKSDGTKYNLYQDGLKIYTTIDSRMQAYAESVVREWLTGLQDDFFKEKKKRKNGIFPSNFTQKDIDGFIERAILQSERYRVMKASGMSKSEIIEAFDKPVDMKIFSWRGDIDTVMSPKDSLLWAKSFARVGFMSMEPSSGHVKAYVGGPDFTHFQYDMTTQGRRQVGSTVKPFIYTLAMEEGMYPCDKIINKPITLTDANGKPFTPRNGSKARLNEEVTLRWMLQNSNNWGSATLMSMLAPEQLVKLMRSFGLSGYIPPVVSLCLGPNEVSVSEMVSAYTTFPNKGIRVTPVFVTHITDNKGNVIANFTTNTTEVINEKTSYKMINMMQAVLDGGTGSRVRYKYGVRASAGGKTGTTNDNSDGWFIGYTPELVSGVWVGWEDRQIHFASMAEGQGANMALPIWAMYMKKVLEDTSIGYNPSARFNIPEWFNPNEGCE
ncbi:MAG: transglycosylase domain-containing protein [Bacteroidota bacterium]|jgi:penicillin-binding protein 1A|nr:penicillin-binding protein 1A [Bacteroidetes oral taxon 274 str. F0058]